jgi:hypothetical protein
MKKEEPRHEILKREQFSKIAVFSLPKQSLTSSLQCKKYNKIKKKKTKEKKRKAINFFFEKLLNTSKKKGENFGLLSLRIESYFVCIRIEILL